MTGSDELVRDCLAFFGFEKFDSYGLARPEDIRAFYGVSAKYYDNILTRYHINGRYSSRYAKYAEKRFTENGCYRSERITKLTACAVLALSALMYHGRGIPDNSTVKRVYDGLTKTRYYAKAKEKREAYMMKRWREEQEKAIAEEDAKTSRSSAMPLMSFDKVHNTVETGGALIAPSRDASGATVLPDAEIAEITPSGQVRISVISLAKLIKYIASDIDTNPQSTK